MQILFGLRQLPSYGINHDLLLFHHGQKRCFLRQDAMDFLGFSLAFQLDFRDVVLVALNLKFDFIIFCLQHPSLVSFLLDFFRISYELLILVDLQLVSLLPEIQWFLLGFTESSLEIIDISSKLSLQFSVLARILNSQLKSVVVRYEFGQFFLVPLLDVWNHFFILDLRRVYLGWWQLMQSFALKVLFGYFLDF